MNQTRFKSEPVKRMAESNGTVKVDFMVKRSQQRNSERVNYKKRWFVLSQNSLKYFDGTKESGRNSERGSISLDKIIGVEYADLDNKPNAFQVLHRENDNDDKFVTLYILAENSSQREDWVVMIRQCSYKKGATFIETYHPGVWDFDKSKYTCCPPCPRFDKGCKYQASANSRKFYRQTSGSDTRHILKTDFMIKRSQQRRSSHVNYKRRWFILTQTLLIYRTGKQQAGPDKERGRLSLQDVVAVEFADPIPLGNRENAFQVVYRVKEGEGGVDARVLYVMASSSQQRDDWVRCLRKTAIESGAQFNPTYHKGVWQKKRYSCCKETDRLHCGCQPASPQSLEDEGFGTGPSFHHHECKTHSTSIGRSIARDSLLRAVSNLDLSISGERMDFHGRKISTISDRDVRHISSTVKVLFVGPKSRTSWMQSAEGRSSVSLNIHNDGSLDRVPVIMDGIERLSFLVEMYLSDCMLQEMPDSIIELRNLRILDLCNNRLDRLPSGAYKLRRLECLCLSGNGFRELPDDIGCLKLLRVLSVSHNKLKCLPDDICTLSKLQTLILDFNNIIWLPVDLFCLQHLNIPDREYKSMCNQSHINFRSGLSLLGNVNLKFPSANAKDLDTEAVFGLLREKAKHPDATHREIMALQNTVLESTGFRFWTDMMLHQIASQLGADQWRSVILYLGIDDTTITHVESDNRRLADTIFRLLIKWRQGGKDEESMMDKMSDVLSQLKLNSLESYIRERYNEEMRCFIAEESDESDDEAFSIYL